MPVYEVAAAFLSSAAIAPVMTIIDTAIIKSQFEKISLSKAISETIKDFGNNLAKTRVPLQIMTGVYFSTYATANLTELTCRSMDIDYKIPTVTLTSIVNVAAIAYKDREYAKLFERSSVTFPFRSYALFALRDALTITSSFVIKKDVIQYLDRQFPAIPHNTNDLIASFLIPAAFQLLSTPIHILSLDLYSRPYASTYERLSLIRQTYRTVCGGRILRIIPAFGVGGFINDMIRPRRLDEPHVPLDSSGSAASSMLTNYYPSHHNHHTSLNSAASSALAVYQHLPTGSNGGIPAVVETSSNVVSMNNEISS